MHIIQPPGPGRLGISTRSRDREISASVYVVEVFSGETAVLPCPPPPSDPPATITFYKNGKAMTENGMLVTDVQFFHNGKIVLISSDIMISFGFFLITRIFLVLPVAIAFILF